MSDLYWEDSTNAGGLQAGQDGYAGYFNGPFANLSSIHARFPGKPVMGYATRITGSHGADAIDCEPGTLGQDFATNAAGALRFIGEWTGGSGLFSKAIVYTMAAWQASMEGYLGAHGIPRSAYYLNSAHANGKPHYCGPATCGFGRTQADMTQYLFAGAYDRTIMNSYMLKSVAPPVVSGTILPPTVRKGDHGKYVVMLRVHLDAWGAGLPRNADNGTDTFGAMVDAAVRKFQRDHKLTVDGVVGPVTWAHVLLAPLAPVPPVPAPAPKPPAMPTSVLKLGDKGADVRLLQAKLAGSGLVGVRGITVDGVFGNQTETAVRNLQRLKGLTQDGIVGPKTWAAVWKL